MGDRQILNAIRDLLNDNLLDPRSQWTGQNRNWCHTDNPLLSATFPRIQVRKRGPTQTVVSSMGRSDFLEWRLLTIDIQIWFNSDFKYDIGDGVFIKNEELVKEWLPKIWRVIKDNHTYLVDNYGVSGLKALDEDDPYLEPDTDKYTGTLSIRLWEWER